MNKHRVIRESCVNVAIVALQSRDAPAQGIKAHMRLCFGETPRLGSILGQVLSAAKVIETLQKKPGPGSIACSAKRLQTCCKVSSKNHQTSDLYTRTTACGSYQFRRLCQLQSANAKLWSNVRARMLSTFSGPMCASQQFNF